MVALTGMLALAVSVGHLRYQQRALQRAVDAAALAAALEIPYCAGSPNCAVMREAATSAAAENGFKVDAVVTNCGSAPSTGMTLILNDPPCALGSRDPRGGKSGNVEAFVSQPVQSPFASVMGFGSVPVMARAEAAVTAPTNCIYALDPTGSASLAVYALASLTSSCGVVVESSSSSALSCALLGVVSVPRTNVVGGAANLLCIISPNPVTHAPMPSPADPLAYLPAPVIPACGTTTTPPFHGAPANIVISGAATLFADAAYCGGITIQPGATVSFQPGTYVLTSTNGGMARGPGGLTINLGTSVTGTGVTFYNYGPAGGINFNAPSLSLAGVRLIAPTTGTYAGILFFQPANNTSAAALSGSAAYNTVLQGAYYFPTASVTFACDGLGAYNILVAWRITFQLLTFGFTPVKSAFSNDYSTLPNGSPLASISASLSQ